jgi:uncharacterized circularly permuted ATP-grasp superfamily protein
MAYDEKRKSLIRKEELESAYCYNHLKNMRERYETLVDKVSKRKQQILNKRRELIIITNRKANLHYRLSEKIKDVNREMGPSYLNKDMSIMAWTGFGQISPS